MSRKFRQMSCYILAGGEENRKKDFEPAGELTRLEKGYRRYAALFEKVKLVIKKDQAHEHYLNYPHILDGNPTRAAVVGLAAALNDSGAEHIFVGNTESADFSLDMAFNLVKEYKGEPFLGYQKNDGSQYLFGIYHSTVAPKVKAALERGEHDLGRLLADDARLIPLPGKG